MVTSDLSTTFLDEELQYQRDMDKTYRSPDSQYSACITSLMNLAGKNLRTIRKEILFAEQQATLTTSEGETLEQSLDRLTLDDSVERYFMAWAAHDSFAYATSQAVGKILLDPAQRLQTMQRFISNDQLIRVHVSKNLPLILAELRKKVSESAGRDYIPLCPSFEIFLLDEAQAASQSDACAQRFADTYTYGNLEVAREEISRLFKPAMEATYERIRNKRRDDLRRAEEELAFISSRADPKDLHRYLRLTRWAAFEEPRKRYIIEGGIVDYLFRELAFRGLKEKSADPLLEKFSFSLQMPQEQFLEILRRQADVRPS